uniref:POF1B actin binding protein n=1 Tax=Cyprinodon variegatus TaxID=28743 RepID=A0A3Q2G9J4_CYPVA
MSVHTTQKVRTYKTLTTEPVTTQVFSTRSVSPMSPMSPVPQVSPVSQVTSLPITAVNGSYESVRYLVPVQQAMPQQSYFLMQQPMMQQTMMSPMYVQTLPRVSTSSNETEFIVQQQQQRSFVEEEVELEVEEDQSGSVEVEEVEIVNVYQQKPATVKQRFSVSEQRDVPEPTKLDTRYFGELLADVYRKNCDIHSYISENVSRIRGQKHSRDIAGDLKVEKQEVDSLIPKGATELTKQQMRYLLQTRFTAEKSMRLLLSTFSSLREELMQMAEDMRRLEVEKEALERDLNFKADQARQYDSLLEGVRENNRQLQLSLKEATATQRSLESKLMSSRDNDTAGGFKIKELEGRMRAMEKENEMLKQKLAGQASNGNLHLKTEALAQHYKEQLQTLSAERDAEIENLRSQISKLQTKITTTTTSTTSSSSRSSTDSSLQLKISELLSKLEQREKVIKQKEEEIRKLMMERNDSSKNVTKTIITKRYRNQYPMLGLLSDDYQVTSPVKEDKTIVIERTGEMFKQEIIMSP